MNRFVHHKYECSVFNLLGLGMSEDVRLEVGGLGKLLVAAVKWTDIRPVPCVNSHVCSQVEVQRKALSAAFKCTLHKQAQSKADTTHTILDKWTNTYDKKEGKDNGQVS